jgi:hypothetical protein
MVPEGAAFLEATLGRGEAPLAAEAGLCQVAPATATAAPLRLHVRPLGGFRVEVALVNEGRAPVRACRRLAFPADVGLDLTDPSGRRAAGRRVISTPREALADILADAVEPGVIVAGFAWNGDRYERPAGLTSGDFEWLAPGAEFRRTFDLAALVRAMEGDAPLTGPVAVRATWRNLESGRRLGLEPLAVVGALASEVVPLR